VDRYSFNWRGWPLQVGYALSGVTLGPEAKKLVDMPRGTSCVVIVWEHANGLQCWTGPPLHRDWNDVIYDTAHTHYPRWHGPGTQFLFCDGHAAFVAHDEIVKALFYIQ
jgi:prepilin-type processing-associated H-X9-DG protein